MLDKKPCKQVFITVETKMLFQYIKHRQYFLYRKASFQVTRNQFPLTLAWAVTIHKCHELTLAEIVIDMTPVKGKLKLKHM